MTRSYGPFAPNGCLTEAGQKFLTEWLEEWSRPSLLLLRHMPYLFREAERAFGSDDTNAICVAGAVRGLAHFEPDRVGEFSTYAAWSMANEVQSELRKRRLERDRRVVYLSDDKEGAAAIYSLPATVDDAPADREFRQHLRREVRAILHRNLPSWRHREMLALRFGLHDGQERTISEIAGIFGVSGKRVSEIQDSAMAKILPALEKFRPDG